MSPARTAVAVLAPALVLAGLWSMSRAVVGAAPGPARAPQSSQERVPATAAAVAAANADFVAHWHDGKAEVDGYRYQVSRYGEPRTGQAVAIYVTEPFSARRMVKVDDAARDPSDTFQVLKLNLVRDFQTGIYDYNTMLSVFARTEGLTPVKVSFSSTEWCGNVYEELRVEEGRVRQTLFSYFDGETGTATLPRPAGGILEDELFVRLRGLRGEFLRPGEKRRVPFLGGAFFRRLAHQPARWSSAAIERRPASERIVVPAGTFDAAAYAVVTDDGREGRFWIEATAPHRVVKWSWRALASASRLGGLDSGELTGTRRVEYWQLHRGGDEQQLRALGIAPLPGPPASN